MQRLSTRPKVSITESGDRCYVKVHHADGSVDVEDFKMRAFAVSFAEGQRIGLGLNEIEREEAPSGWPPADQIPAG